MGCDQLGNAWEAAQFRRHDNEAAAAESREEEISARASELYLGEFLPGNPDNIQEAMGNLPQSDYLTIRSHWISGRFGEVGFVLIEAVTKYWHQRAKDRATAEYDANLEGRQT